MKAFLARNHKFRSAICRRARALTAVVWVCAFWGKPTTQANQATGPNARQVLIIVVSSRNEAEQVLERLRAGDDFATVARQESTDPSAENGGSLGAVDPATLRSELRDALENSAPGQLVGPVKIPSGYAILKIEAARGATATPGGAPGAPDAQTATAPPGGSGQGMTPTAMLALAGRGNISYPPDVSGAVEVEVAFRNLPKPPDWERDLQSICQARKQTLALAVDHLKDLLDPDNPDSYATTRPDELGRVHYSLAQLLAYQGKMEPAIQEWLQAYKLAPQGAPQMVPELEEVLGTAYLHKSEMENDVYRAPGERCIFPPRTPVLYQKTGDSEKAIQYFSRFLARKPETLEVKWLLNLAYLTMGKYPSGVPAKYRIPPSAFESQESIGRFVDVAPAAGLNSISMAGGIIVEDFDNDGLLDIVTSSYDSCEPLHFFHNNGNGTFTDKAVAAGLGGQLGGLNLIQTDFNNDGCIDILVLRGGWQSAMRPSLLKNNCDGTFTDVTTQSGLGNPVASQTAVWTDIDNDGFLDLFIGNEQGPSKLYRNRGDGTFEDISHSAGVDGVAFSKGVVAADYDNDGFPDLFVTSYYMSTNESLLSRFKLPHNAETLKLYRNLGDGTFRDVTSEVGLDRVFNPMGANFGDLDNDGYLDFYLGTGTPPYGDILPHALFRNQEGKRFVDITASSGTGEIHKGHGVAFADLDNDGHEELIEEVGGAVPGDRHALRLFHNPGNDNDWISLRLVGVKTNRAAIGTRIKLTVENQGDGQRTIFRTVGSGGSFGASPLQQHLGLGKAARIVNLEVWWPASNTRQNFPDVRKNQFLEITEFSQQGVKLERPRFKLGGPGSAGSPGKTAVRNTGK